MDRSRWYGKARIKDDKIERREFRERAGEFAPSDGANGTDQGGGRSIVPTVYFF